MTAYLNHGVKAPKMCETTAFVNAVGAHYVPSRPVILFEVKDNP